MPSGGPYVPIKKASACLPSNRLLEHKRSGNAAPLPPGTEVITDAGNATLAKANKGRPDRSGRPYETKERNV